MMWQIPFLLALTVLWLGAPSPQPARAATGELASPWAQGHNSRARLIAGRRDAGSSGLLAGIEVQMPAGWKTYWRNPGDAGGVPPSFDWSKSENLASAKVLYPAPQRFTDRAGDTVGYKDMVVFPVRLEPKDPTKPITLHLSLDYGICKEICIPAEATLTLDIAADASSAFPEQLADALQRVPQSGGERKSGDPVLKRVASELSGAKPRVILEVEFPAGGAHADAFIEAPPGLYVPMPKKIDDDGAGRVTFELDLSEGVDVDGLKDENLTLTLVSDAGQSEVEFDIR